MAYNYTKLLENISVTLMNINSNLVILNDTMKKIEKKGGK